MFDRLDVADRFFNTMGGMSRCADDLVTERRHGWERRYHLVLARLGPVRDWIAQSEWF